MKALFFDLDNTLYDSKQYFFGAFKEISEYLSKKYKIPSWEINKKLKSLWQEKTSFYKFLFNDLLDNFDLEKELEEVIQIFNSYNSKLKSYPDTVSTLKALKKKGYKLGIITDGNISRQNRKIERLGIKDFFEVIIFTKEINKSKSSENPFLIAAKKMKILSEEAFYVGDNPAVDFEGAKRAGMKTIRLLKGEFKNKSGNKYIDYEIKKLNELLEIARSYEEKKKNCSCYRNKN